MHTKGYLWRQLTPRQQQELLQWRKKHHRPWHSPPHAHVAQTAFHLAAACYEHAPYIGSSPERLDAFADSLLEHLKVVPAEVVAWCVLPNHYHALVLTRNNLDLVRVIGRFHGRTSYLWNGEDNARGRKVFFRCIDKPVKSDRHMQATINYIHNNPVHHGYVRKWQDWPWSSAIGYLTALGWEEVMRRWREYPVLDMGKNWDPPEM